MAVGGNLGGMKIIAVAMLSVLMYVCRAEKVCIIGSGVAGSSAAYILKTESSRQFEIDIFEQHDHVGGRLATVKFGDDEFEAGGSVIHNKNLLMISYAELLGLKRTIDDDDGNDSFGIWNGREFVFQFVRYGDSMISRQWAKFRNYLSILWRYGLSLWKMQKLVTDLTNRCMGLYSDDRVFDSIEDLLRSVGLYDLTQRTVREELLTRGISELLIDELLTMIMRINYNQNVSISGLAGAVSLAGSGEELWFVDGGNRLIPEGLVKLSNASLHLSEKVTSVTFEDGVYKVGLASGQSNSYDAVIIATPLDEENIAFEPPLTSLNRTMQHTHTTFVRGIIKQVHFAGTNFQKDVEFLQEKQGFATYQLLPHQRSNQRTKQTEKPWLRNC